MDPFELLKKDHKTVSQLFKEIESSSGKWKIKRFKQLKSELDLHAHIEETIFYPALEKAKETRPITLEGYEEHKVIKELLAELDSAASVTDEWTAKFTVLKENVEHHVKEEENEMFDHASDVLTGEQAENLGDKMAAEKTKRGGKVDPSLTKADQKKGLLQSIAGVFGLGSSEPAGKKSKKADKPGGKATSAKAPVKKSAKASKGSKTKAAGAKRTKSGASGKGGSKARAAKKPVAKASVKKKAVPKR